MTQEIEINYRFTKLPIEIINYILLFDGKVIYKNGKYYNKIPQNDYRCIMLKSLPIPNIHISNTYYEFSVTVKFTDKKYVLILQKFAYGKYANYMFINKRTFHIESYTTLLL